MSEQQIPRASTLRRVLVSLAGVAAAAGLGFFYGLFGYYAISYLGLIIAAVWAVVTGLIVRFGKLTHPDFTVPLGLFLAAVLILTALLTAYHWTRSDVRSDFDRWLETHQPDAGTNQAWRRFMREALDDDSASGGPFDVVRLKAHRGERHQRDGHQTEFVRRGVWAWWCWLVLSGVPFAAGLAATLLGASIAADKSTAQYRIREHLRVRRRVKEAQRRKPRHRSKAPGIPSPAWPRWRPVITALWRGYPKFILPLVATGVASWIAFAPGRDLLAVFALSGLWVSAAFAALEPERDDGFSWRRLGGHFVNLLGILMLLFLAMFLVMPVIILAAGPDSDLAPWLYGIGVLLGMLRLWPVYTMRYLYRGEDDNPALHQRGWGFDLIAAWRLTRAPGSLWRATLWALGTAFGVIAIMELGNLYLPDDVRWVLGWAGLLVLHPLVHLVIAERAIALRDAQDIESVLKTVARRMPEADESRRFRQRMDDVVARQAASVDEAERLQDVMDAVPEPLIRGGDGLVDWARAEQEKAIGKKGREDPKNWMVFGIRLGRLDWIHNALDQGVSINAPVELEMPPLVLGATRGPELIEFLLERGADIEGVDKWGRTALWHCADSGRIEALRCLLDHGADPDVEARQGTPVVAALARDHVQAAQMLHDAGVDLDQVTGSGQTLLGLAADRGKLKSVRWLIRQGSAIEQTMPSAGWMGGYTPLALSVRSGHLAVARELARAGADVQLRLAKGRTLLMEAANYGHLELCRWLIEQGVDPNIKDESGHDAVTYAEFQDRPKTAVAEFIRNHPGYHHGR